MSPSFDNEPSADPHAGQPVLRAGSQPAQAAGALVMLHGRGGTAESIFSLYSKISVSQLAVVAPQAADNAWYPQSFLAPVEANRIHLNSALARLRALIDEFLNAGVPAQRIALLGFSQGACLSAEFIARHPRRYGAIMCLTGGLVGPPGTQFNYPGALDGTPVFLGTSDPDRFVPYDRVADTAATLTRMGAAVDFRRYPGLPHTVNLEELETCRSMLEHMILQDEP
jgi:phospholipase/carboxylesterase